MITRFSMMALLVIMSAQVQAAPSETTWMAVADMKVIDSRYDFAGLEKVELLVLFDDESKTGIMLLTYGEQKEALEVVSATDSNGVRSFVARLPDTNANGARFSIILEDSIASDGQRTWSASVRKGFGWCGTMDSTMELLGTPEL